MKRRTVFGCLIALAAVLWLARGAALAGCEWVNPLPQGHTFYAGWSGATDTYIVGEYGAIFHYDGTNGRLVDSGTYADLYGIWGSTSNDIYAVGYEYDGSEGLIVHFDGTRWSKVNISPSPTGALHAVWGTAAGNVYVAGDSGALYHYNGSSWQLVSTGLPTASFRGIWGMGASDFYIVGENGGSGLILHWNGVSLQTVATGLPVSYGFTAVWGSSATDVIVVGDGGAIHLSGANWSAMSSDAGDWLLTSVWGAAADNVYAVSGSGKVLHYGGAVANAWTTVSSGWRPLQCIWGSGAFNIAAAGERGTVVLYQGAGWSAASRGLYLSYINGLWGSDESNTYVIGTDSDTGRDVLYHFDGEAASFVADTAGRFTDIWGSSATDIFVVGYKTPTIPDDGAPLVPITSIGTVLHYNGSGWASMTIPTAAGVPTDLHATWGSAGNDVFAVGASGTVLHYNGSDWTSMTLPAGAETLTFNDVWGTASNNVYAAAASGRVFRYNGVSWSEMPPIGTTEDIDAIWASSATDVFAASFTFNEADPPSSVASIYHFNGTIWSTMALPTGVERFRIHSIWGASAWDVYAVGAEGTMLHYDGHQWKVMRRTTGYDMVSVWGMSAHQVFATGYMGAILRCSPDYALAVDFEAQGLWGTDAGRWTKLAASSPDRMATYRYYLVAAFGASGLYQYDGQHWTRLSPSGSPEAMMGAGGDLYLDYGTSGTYRYDAGWLQITKSNPSLMAAYKGTPVAVFPGSGLYHYNGSGVSWTRLTTNAAVEDMVEASDALYVDYGSSGLWRYNGSWGTKPIHTGNPTRLGIYHNQLIATFPTPGLQLYNGTSWQPLRATGTFLNWVEANGDLYAIIQSQGLWRLHEGSWSCIHPSLPTLLARWGQDIVAGFGSAGLWRYDGSRWSLVTSSSGASDLLAVRKP